VSGLAPRAREDSVRPRRLSGACARPLNFTVRRLASMPRSVRLSLWLFLGGVALGFAMIPFDARPWPPGPEAPVFIMAIFLGVALFGALACRIAYLPGAELGAVGAARADCRGFTGSFSGRSCASWRRTGDHYHLRRNFLHGDRRRGLAIHTHLEPVVPPCVSRFASLLTIVEGAVMRGWLCAAGAGRQYAPAALIGRFWAAAQLHR